MGNKLGKIDIFYCLDRGEPWVRSIPEIQPLAVKQPSILAVKKFVNRICTSSMPFNVLAKFTLTVIKTMEDKQLPLTGYDLCLC